MASITKRYPVDVLRRRAKLIPAALVAFATIPFLQATIDPTLKDMNKGQDLAQVSGGLGSEFLLLPLLGFREAAAGLLWVRCDEFFHSGDYDAILPLVRLITWLDPHSDNVYITGAWHLAYNFTDSSERSDRRYIPPSQALLEEGIQNNMHIFDIKFEKGWQNYDKIKDYVAAERAFKLADTTKPKPGTDEYPYGAPLRVLHILAHTYERMGRAPDALATWKTALDRSEEILLRPLTDEQKKPYLSAKENIPPGKAWNEDAERTLYSITKDYTTRQLREAQKHNYASVVQRYYDRFTSTNHSKVNPTKFPAVLAPPPVSKDQTPRPWDIAFEPSIEVVRPKVLKIGGIGNFGDGARVEVRITDWGYQERAIDPKNNNFQVDDSVTIMQDALSVRKSKFSREIDMSKDPKMYSFGASDYKIMLSFNPRSTSPHLQDRYGWSGEGLTDANTKNVYVDARTEVRGTKMIEGQGGEGPVWDGKTIPWTQYGQPPRMIRVTYKVSRDQIMGLKPITNKDIVPNE
jgi:hypothetical protein